MLYTISKCLKSRTKALLVAFTFVLIGAGCASTKAGSVAASDSVKSGERIITGISTSDEAEAVKIKIQGNSPLRYTSVKQSSPLGIVLYFPGTKLEGVNPDYQSAEGLVLNSVKTSQQGHASGFDSRVQILLNKDVDYDVVREENGIVVSLPKTENVSVKEAVVAEEANTDTVQSNDTADVEDEGIASVESAPLEEAPVVTDQAVKEQDNLVAAENSPGETGGAAADVPAATPDSFEKAATTVIGVSKKVEDDHVVVDIKADGKIDDYKIFTLPSDKNNSARIVCDIFKLNGLKTKGEQKLAVNTKGVTRVRYCSSPDKLRVVVDTNDDNLKAYNASSGSEGIEISIGSKLLADATVSSPAVDSVSDSSTPETSAVVVPSEDVNDNEAETPETVLAEEKTVAEVAESDIAPSEPSEKAIEEPAAVTPAPASSSEKTWVKRIDFTSEKNGKSSFIIETAHPVKYTSSKKNNKTIHFRLYNTKLPKSRKFPFITTRFESAVNRIIPVQTKGMKDNVLFIIELREAVPFDVDQQGEVLKINFAKSSVRPRPESKAGLPAWKTVLSRTAEIQDIEMEAAVADGGSAVGGSVAPLRAGSDSPTAKDLGIESGSEITAVGPGAGRSSGTRAPADAEPEDMYASGTDRSSSNEMAYASWASTKKRYTGEKISVDFYETDIKNVFRIIRAVSGQNFAIDKDVTGKVTMTLDRPVPWDQVLDLVLKMNMLGMTTDGGINRIATLETLKQEEEKRLEYIAAEEKTKLKKKALEPLTTEYILINYSNAEKEIVPHIEKLLTAERGKISVDARTNQVILTDTKEVIRQAKGLIRKLDKITPQVVIEARIVEATTTFSRSLGTEWNLNSNPNYDIYNDTLGGTYGYQVAMNNSVAAKSSIGINFTKLTGAQFLLNAKLLAMESKGEGKIISAPKVLTMDNKEATITQGVEVPFSTVSSEGTQTTFKKIELKLTVTPHVTADNKISLKVLIDKNDVGGITDIGPTITTKKVESELLISDGDTIVIGGIIKSNKSVTDEGLPFFQHQPVVGWLFKSRIRSEEKQELLVFLTPRIVSYEETER